MVPPLPSLLSVTMDCVDLSLYCGTLRSLLSLRHVSVKLFCFNNMCNEMRDFLTVLPQITRTLTNNRFEVLTVVLLKIQVISNVAPRCWANSSLHFKASKHTHLHSFFLAYLTLKMKELQSFHTLVMTCPAMQHQTFHFAVFIFTVLFRIRTKITCTDSQPLESMLSSLVILKIRTFLDEECRLVNS